MGSWIWDVNECGLESLFGNTGFKGRCVLRSWCMKECSFSYKVAFYVVLRSAMLCYAAHIPCWRRDDGMEC